MTSMSNLYPAYRHNASTEARTPNGDLSFDHTDDKIIGARNNLRYWIDRYEQANPTSLEPLHAAAQWMVATVDREYVAPAPAEPTPPAEPANGNDTRYAEKWMECNRALMAALANPSQVAFDRAATYAGLACGSAYASTNEGVEWEMAQSLLRMVRDVARECGYTITGS